MRKSTTNRAIECHQSPTVISQSITIIVLEADDFVEIVASKERSEELLVAASGNARTNARSSAIVVAEVVEVTDLVSMGMSGRGLEIIVGKEPTCSTVRDRRRGSRSAPDTAGFFDP